MKVSSVLFESRLVRHIYQWTCFILGGESALLISITLWSVFYSIKRFKMLSGLSNKMHLTGEWRYDKIVILKNYRKIDWVQLILWFVTNVIAQVFASKAACAPMWRAQLCTNVILFDLLEPISTFVVVSILLSGVYWKLGKIVKDDHRVSINKATVACFLHMYLVTVYICLCASRFYWWLLVLAIFGFAQDCHIFLRMSLYMRLADYPSESKIDKYKLFGCLHIPVQSFFLWPCGICCGSNGFRRNGKVKKGFKKMNIESSNDSSSMI